MADCQMHAPSRAAIISTARLRHDRIRPPGANFVLGRRQSFTKLIRYYFICHCYEIFQKTWSFRWITPASWVGCLGAHGLQQETELFIDEGKAWSIRLWARPFQEFQH